jgi:non-ribosomal peptide synthetase component E (peptide arylation enzyme)
MIWGALSTSNCWLGFPQLHHSSTCWLGTIMLYAQTTESAVRALASGTTLAEQLLVALAAAPRTVVADDERAVTYRDLLFEAQNNSRRWSREHELVPLHSRNDLTFLAELLGVVFAGCIPVLYLDESAAPDIGPVCVSAEPTADGWWVSPGTALILTSGGTTGIPKLIARTHADYLLNLWLTIRNAELTSADCLLLPIPVGHNYGLGCPGVFGAILSGASIVLTRSSSLEHIVALGTRHHATVVPLVPTQVRRWYGRGDGATGAWRLVQVGGSVVTGRDVRELRALFRSQVQTSFGMAEGLLCQSAPDDRDEQRESATGRMLSLDDQYRIIAPDQTGLGALQVRGPYTITRYIGPDSVNRHRFLPGGWFVTGDLARAVDDRRFTAHGRADDMINRGGELIDPSAVERLTLSHPKVLEAVAVAQPHPVLEALSTVYVTVTEPVSGTAILRDLLAKHPSSVALPDRVVPVSEIPLTLVGKADRSKLV